MGPQIREEQVRKGRGGEDRRSEGVQCVPALTLTNMSSLSRFVRAALPYSTVSGKEKEQVRIDKERRTEDWSETIEKALCRLPRYLTLFHSSLRSSPLAHRSNMGMMNNIRGVLNKQGSKLDDVNGNGPGKSSGANSPKRSPHGSLDKFPPRNKSSAESPSDSFDNDRPQAPTNSANGIMSQISLSRMRRQPTLDEEDGFHDDDHHDDAMFDDHHKKKPSRRFSFTQALGKQIGRRISGKKKDKDDDNDDHSLSPEMSSASASNRSHGSFGGMKNLFRNKHDNHQDISNGDSAYDSSSRHTNNKWSLASKFSGRSHATKVRGVMKLEAVEDSVLLFLDRGRQKKFLKKYPNLRDVVEVLMHAKIDNFLSKLPFIKAETDHYNAQGRHTAEEDEAEHDGLGMLSSVCKYQAFSEGEPIFCEGEYGDKLYIILKGSCAVLNAFNASAVTPEKAPKDAPKENEKDVAAKAFASRENDAGNDSRKETGSDTSTQPSTSDGNAPDGGTKENGGGVNLPGSINTDPPHNTEATAQGAGARRSSMQKSNSSVKAVAPKPRNSGTRKSGKRSSSKTAKGGSERSFHEGRTLRKGTGKANMVESIKKRFKKGETKMKIIDYQPEEVLATLKSGSYFGEMAVMVNMPRSSTVVAAEKCLLLTVSKKSWQEFLEYHEHTRQAVEAHMKSRLMIMFSKMEIPFFEKAAKKQFEELSGGCEVFDLPAGNTIMKQGDRGDTFYVIINGAVEVDVKAKPGKADGPKKDWKGWLYAGQYFGEIALVLDSPRKATVTTVEDTVLLVINAATFKMFFKDNPRALAEVQVRLLGERAELHSLLAITGSLDIFKEFLEAEHSSENVEFWIECQEFERAYDPKKYTMENMVEQEGTRKIDEMVEITRMWNLYIKVSKAGQGKRATT